MSTFMRYWEFTTATFQLDSDPDHPVLRLYSSIVFVCKETPLIIFLFFSYAMRVYNFLASEFPV